MTVQLRLSTRESPLIGGTRPVASFSAPGLQRSSRPLARRFANQCKAILQPTE
jgi:hypothetical protein